MQKYLFLIVVLGVIGVGAAGWFIQSQVTGSGTQDMMPAPTPDSMMQPTSDAATMPKTVQEAMMPTTNRYVVFTPQALPDASTTRRVLFFYANWCPTCQPADADITKNTVQIPPDVTIIRVNYNDTETDQAEKDLAKKYGVTYQHTFVQIDAAGNEIAKWNGGGLNEILQKVQ